MANTWKELSYADWLKWLSLGLCGVVVFSLLACAVTPQNTEQTLAQARGQYVGLVKSAVDLRRAGIIDDDLYREIDPVITQGNQALTMAQRALSNGDRAGAQDYISLLHGIIRDLRDQLEPVAERCKGITGVPACEGVTP